MDLLGDLLLVRRLLPLHANVGKRLVKSPKVYIRDSGLVHALLGLETLIQRSGHPVVGQSWEGFVIETVLAAAPWRSQASFYRTSAGAEIDLVLEHKNSHLWAIGIKRGLSAKPGRGFYQAIKDIKPKRSFMVRMPVMTDIRLPSGSRPLASAIWWQNCSAAPPHKLRFQNWPNATSGLVNHEISRSICSNSNMLQLVCTSFWSFENSRRPFGHRT